MIAGALTYLLLAPEKNKQPVASVEKATPADLAPGGNKAVLILANGTTILLDSVSNGTLAREGNARVVKLANGQVIYESEGMTKGELMMNTMRTPRGRPIQTNASRRHAGLAECSELDHLSCFVYRQAKNSENNGRGLFRSSR